MAKKKSKKKEKKGKDIKKKKLKKLALKKKDSKKKSNKKKESKKKDKKEKISKKADVKLKAPKTDVSFEKPKTRPKINPAVSSDQTSNYNVQVAVKMMRALKTKEEVLAFTDGEKRLTITKLIPGVLSKFQ